MTKLLRARRHEHVKLAAVREKEAESRPGGSREYRTWSAQLSAKSNGVLTQLRGELGTAAVEELREHLAGLLSVSRFVSVDLSAVRYVDPSVVEMLADVHADAREHGLTCQVAAASAIVGDVIRATGNQAILGESTRVP